MTTTAEAAALKRQGVRAYREPGGVSPVQAYLKHALVPLDLIDRVLARCGIILDLGCGEGILANLVARQRPDARIIGIDRDGPRLAIARKNAAPNAEFRQGDLRDLAAFNQVDGIILNDVVHHHPFAEHARILDLALTKLRPGGALVLKEVDASDKADRGMTRFFDSRLYPDDPLCFRDAADWQALLARLGAGDVEVHRVRYPWPASRTVFIAQKPANRESLGDQARRVASANLAARSEGKTTVFVTGATGFLGGHLARRLLTQGLDGKPVHLVYLQRDPRRPPPEGLGQALPLAGELGDLPLLAEALESIDYVFHLAAEVKLTKGKDLWGNNHAGTLALLEALRGKSLRRLVHASTMGAVDRAPADDCAKPLTEDVAPNPLSEYGRTKLEAEKAVSAAGLPYAILRIAWGYGPGMTPDTHMWFLTDGVAKGKLFARVAFPGRVSVMTAEDLVEAFCLIATEPRAANQIYFASDGQPIALGDLFRRYASVIGRNRRLIGLPRPVTWLLQRYRQHLPLQIQGLANDVLTVDPAKLKAVGLTPRVPMREGLIRLARAQGNLPALDFPEPRRPVSVVTGAAGGIGRALARALHAAGHGLLLVDVDAGGLAKVAAECDHARTLALDLSRPDAADILEQHLGSEGLYIDWLINNAGIGARGATADIPPDRLRRMLDINCQTLVALSQLAVRHFKRAGAGTLVNIGSSAGYQPLPYMAAYAASKAFVQSFTLGLAGEAAAMRGVRVLLVDPSGTDTGFQATAGVKKGSDEKLLTPDDIARAAVAAVERGANMVTVGRSGKAMSLAARIIPRRWQPRLWARMMQKMR